MSRYEFGSIQVQSPQMKLIIDELSQIDLNQAAQTTFIIVGETGTGKNTMAQFIRKTLFKSKDILIQRNINLASEISHEAKIVTTSNQTWIKLRNEFQRENCRVVSMPTLKERKKDLLDLADFFLQVLSLMNSRPQLKLTEKASEMILQYGWPGQFYEFESTLEAAYEVAVKNESLVLEPQHLSMNKLPQNLELNIGMKLEEIERNFILQTLYFVHQNRTKAAEILGISIRTLRNKINQYRMEGFL